MNDLKQLISKQQWQSMLIMIFRRQQYPVRGIADEALLEHALQFIPDNQDYDVMTATDFPDPCDYHESGRSHAELRLQLRELFGQPVRIGLEPDIYSREHRDRVDEIFEIDLGYYKDRGYEIVKNQDSYESFARDPQRYAWLAEFWQE
jgi:hypothetical protein